MIYINLHGNNKSKNRAILNKLYSTIAVTLAITIAITIAMTIVHLQPTTYNLAYNVHPYPPPTRPDPSLASRPFSK